MSDNAKWLQRAKDDFIAAVVARNQATAALEDARGPFDALVKAEQDANGRLRRAKGRLETEQRIMDFASEPVTTGEQAPRDPAEQGSKAPPSEIEMDQMHTHFNPST